MRMLLENSKVRLRLMEMGDIQDIFEIACHSEIWTHMSIVINKLKDVENYVKNALQQKQNGTEIPFVIIDVTTSKIIGATKLMDIQPIHRRGEIGFTWLTPKYWRTEMNINCKYLLLSYCFETLGWQRVQIKTDYENMRSQMAIERIGAKKEGIYVII